MLVSQSRVLMTKRAVEIMGDRQVMSEYFSARPYSPEKTCLTEVETTDVHIVILNFHGTFENYLPAFCWN